MVKVKKTRKAPIRARKLSQKPNGKSIERNKREEAYAARNYKGFVRNESERERDLVEVAELYLRRYYQWEIIYQINERNPEREPPRDYLYSSEMLAHDLKAICERWRASIVADMNEAKWREIDTINIVEREA